MKAALHDNRKNNIFSLIHIFYSHGVWKGLGLMATLIVEDINLDIVQDGMLRHYYMVDNNE